MILKEVRMESTISTEGLKAKLDRKDPVTVVETLAPERYRQAHYSCMAGEGLMRRPSG
jgi:hypothetical protein